jgi:hypothetical protein
VRRRRLKRRRDRRRELNVEGKETERKHKSRRGEEES